MLSAVQTVRRRGQQGQGKEKPGRVGFTSKNTPDQHHKRVIPDTRLSTPHAARQDFHSCCGPGIERNSWKKKQNEKEGNEKKNEEEKE
ncbi:hypothetical protein E2C01_087207 [Portunus trituberculatus]|uniref:Uncharacterized protein n=1 Tax=Portunus trituberculatus TaxID=210409 RepID=A0A5B7JBU3_PORTR|nr:hypothetical protein [Portunus trituberculatus]